MDASLLIAKIFGPYFVLVTLGMMLNPDVLKKLMEEMPKNTSFVFFAGAVSFITGIVVVLFHNVWVFGWPLIITLIGWIAILKGVCFVMFPRSVKKMVQIYQPGSLAIKIHLSLGFLLGVYLSCVGYF